MPTKSLIKLLELYPDKCWNWDHLSVSREITWEIIRDNPKMPWDWGDIKKS